MLKHLKNYLIAGLLFWLPLFVTFVLIRFLIDLMDRTIKLLPLQYQPQHLLGFNIPGLGLLFTVILLLVTGILVTNILGHKLIHLWEKIVDRIPFVRSIYSAVKQVAQTLFQPSDTSFRKVVLIEYPRKGVWGIAFVTSEKFKHDAIGDEVYTVFVPTTPNPTSGFILLLPKADTIELPITVEDALKMVVSLGVVAPNGLKDLGIAPQNSRAGRSSVKR